MGTNHLNPFIKTDQDFFNQEIARENTHCVKFDLRLQQFGCANVSPLWVADMDFACPPVVSAALMQRAAHPIYGYSLYPESLFTALTQWMLHRHNWSIQRESILMCPGVVPCLSAAILAFSNVGEGIIVQPPVYFPFFTAVTHTQRKLIENPLTIRDGRYQIDFDHLEKCAIQGGKILLLSSPHNPVGRVWQLNELLEILRIARQYNLMIFSDEIHADLVYTPHQHIPLATLAKPADRIITAVAPSKTFNVAGLGLSSLIIDKKSDRMVIQKIFDDLHLSARNPFSIAAFEAAYASGGEWKDALMIYLKETQDLVIEFIQKNLPGISAQPSEGTYLIWLDCRNLKLSDNELAHFFCHEAGIGFNSGISFGTGGSGYMRMNLASPRKVILEALQKIQQAIQKLNIKS
ncbi:MAG: PatB family C-S lyase [Pseudomonadota bacterium]